MPEWAEKQGFADNKVAVEGATLFAESGCLNCHVYLGAGGQNLGAPDLSAEGAKGRGVEWQVAHLKNPSSKTPGSPMPSFAALGDENLTRLQPSWRRRKGRRIEEPRRRASAGRDAECAGTGAGRATPG